MAVDTALESGAIGKGCDADGNGVEAVRELAGLRLVVPCGSSTRRWKDQVSRLGLDVRMLWNFVFQEGRAYARYSAPGSPYEFVITVENGAQRLLGITTHAAGARQVDSSRISEVTGYSSGWSFSWSDAWLFKELRDPVIDTELQARLVSAAEGIVEQARRERSEAGGEKRAFNLATLAAARFLVNSGQSDPLADELPLLLDVPDVNPEEVKALRVLLADPQGRCDEAVVERWYKLYDDARGKVWQRAADERSRVAQAARELELAAERARDKAHLESIAALLEGARQAVREKRWASALLMLSWRLTEASGGADTRLYGPVSERPAPSPEMDGEDLYEALRWHLFKAFRARVRVRLDGAPEAFNERVVENLPPWEAANDATPMLVRGTPDLGSFAVEQVTYDYHSEHQVTGVDTRAAAAIDARLTELKGRAGPLVERYQALQARLERIDERLALPKQQVVLGTEETLGADRQALTRVCGPDPTGGGSLRCENRWTNNTRTGPAHVTAGRSIEETLALEEERPRVVSDLDDVRRELEAIVGEGTSLERRPAPQETRTVKSIEKRVATILVGTGRLTWALERDGKALQRGLRDVDGSGAYNDPKSTRETLGLEMMEYAIQSVAHEEGVRAVSDSLARALGKPTKPLSDADRDALARFVSGEVGQDSIDTLRALGQDAACYAVPAGEPRSCRR